MKEIEFSKTDFSFLFDYMSVNFRDGFHLKNYNLVKILPKKGSDLTQVSM